MLITAGPGRAPSATSCPPVKHGKDSSGSATARFVPVTPAPEGEGGGDREDGDGGRDEAGAAEGGGELKAAQSSKGDGVCVREADEVSGEDVQAASASANGATSNPKVREEAKREEEGGEGKGVGRLRTKREEEEGAESAG